MTFIRASIEKAIINPKKYTNIVFKSIVNRPDKLLKRVGGNKVSIVLHNKKGRVFETQSLFGDVTPWADFHGVPVDAAVMGFSRAGHNKTFIVTDKLMMIEREVKRDVKNGLMEIEYQLKNAQHRLLSYKRKTISFETDGKKFLKRKGTLIETLVNQDTKTFTHRTRDKEAVPMVANLPSEHMATMADKGVREGFMNTVFGDVLKLLTEKPKPYSKLRRALKDEWKDPSNITSIYQSEANYKLPLKIEHKKNILFDKTIRIVTPHGELKESHNVLRTSAKYWGVPFAENIMTFVKNPHSVMGVLLDDGLILHRVVRKLPLDGLMHVYYKLQQTIDNKIVVLGEMRKSLKFEIDEKLAKQVLKGNIGLNDEIGENGLKVKDILFKKLINKELRMHDHVRDKGFKAYMAKEGKLSIVDGQGFYNDTRGLAQEESLHTIAKNAKSGKYKELLDDTISAIEEKNIIFNWN